MFYYDPMQWMQHVDTEARARPPIMPHLPPSPTWVSDVQQQLEMRRRRQEERRRLASSFSNTNTRNRLRSNMNEMARREMSRFDRGMIDDGYSS